MIDRILYSEISTDIRMKQALVRRFVLSSRKKMQVRQFGQTGVCPLFDVLKKLTLNKPQRFGCWGGLGSRHLRRWSKYERMRRRRGLLKSRPTPGQLLLLEVGYIS